MYSIDMKTLVRSSVIAAIDAQAQSLAAIPSVCLMESAALQIFQHWKPLLKLDDRLIFLCGSGNNGGDALAVARYAYNEGYTNQLVVFIGSRPSVSFEVQKAIIAAYGISTCNVSELGNQELALADWIVDGLFGTGLRGSLHADLCPLVEAANASTAQILAIDIPSGLGDSVPVDQVHIVADLTITMGFSKRVLYHPAVRTDCGRIIVINPSFPPFLLDIVEADADLYDSDDLRLDPLASDDYKTSRGHVALFGGSGTYTGAARLAARACFVSRAGLVTLFCDPEVYPIAASESPSVMVRIFEDDRLDRYTVLLAGPGWGAGREALLEHLFASSLPLVLDADGINAYATMLKEGKRPTHGPLVLTPHLGELRNLVAGLWPEKAVCVAKQDAPDDFFTLLSQLADQLDATLVVKSSLVYIVQKGRATSIIDGGNPSLGVAGSGDVLAGIITALLAKIGDLQQACIQGVLVHQRAGVLAAQTYGYYDSETLLSFVGKAVAEAEQ